MSFLALGGDGGGLEKWMGIEGCGGDDGLSWVASVVVDIRGGIGVSVDAVGCVGDLGRGAGLGFGGSGGFGCVGLGLGEGGGCGWVCGA